jgi:type I restriction enzyme S subunit
MRLGETCILKAGSSISSFEIAKIQDEVSSVPCYGGNGIRGYVKTANRHGDYPLIGRQGALCGNVQYARGDFYATEHAVVVSSEKAYIPRFLFHLLVHMNLNQYKSAGAQPGLSVKNLQEISAPVPPLSEQRRIVEILDRFDKLCNDISEGLPAEIEARRKQYEYYRDKLLSFEEVRT